MRRPLAACLAALLAVAPGCFAAADECGERRLTDDPVPSRLTYNFARSIAVDGSGGLHVVWYEETAPAQVRYARSLDSGRTWEMRGRLSEDPRGGQHPSIATSGSSVYVAWHTSEPKPRVMLRRSRDRGGTWDAARTIAAPTAGAAHGVVAADGARVHLVWGDNTDPSSEIHAIASTDGGETWDHEMRLSPLGSFSWVPTVAVSGETVLAAWVDYRDGNEEEYVRRSDDGGATWGPPLRLTDDPADSWAPTLALAGGIAHIAWFDRRHSRVSEIDVERELDGALALVGASVEPIPTRDPERYYLDELMPRLQTKAERVKRAAPESVRAGGDPKRIEDALRRFEDAMREWTDGWEIYYKRSPDGGRSWGPDVRLTAAAGTSARPSIAVSGTDVVVTWWDGRDGDDEIYVKRSRDGGLTWAPDIRVTRSQGASQHPSIAFGADGAAHVVWHDERHGNAEIFYRRLGCSGAP